MYYYGEATKGCWACRSEDFNNLVIKHQSITLLCDYHLLKMHQALYVHMNTEEFKILEVKLKLDGDRSREFIMVNITKNNMQECKDEIDKRNLVI